MRTFVLALTMLVFLGAGCTTTPERANDPLPAAEPQDIGQNGSVAAPLLPLRQRPQGTVRIGYSEFGRAVEYSEGTSHTFRDGLEVRLERVKVSLCPSGVVCFWEGEVGGYFRLSGGTLPASVEQYLGTVTKREVDVEGYHLTLEKEVPAGDSLALVVIVSKR